MTVDLRIPVTEDQKAIIDKAVLMTERRELATWAREQLLSAARTLIDSKKKRKAGDSNPLT